MKKEESLLELLNKNEKWPLRYMFKFITQNDEKLIEEVKNLLPINGAIDYKKSKGDKYIAITCIADMPTAQSIVDTTEKVGRIKGILSL